jgi:hypothetical protein
MRYEGSVVVLSSVYLCVPCYVCSMLGALYCMLCAVCCVLYALLSMGAGCCMRTLTPISMLSIQY